MVRAEASCRRDTSDSDSWPWSWRRARARTGPRRASERGPIVLDTWGLRRAFAKAGATRAASTPPGSPPPSRTPGEAPTYPGRSGRARSRVVVQSAHALDARTTATNPNRSYRVGTMLRRAPYQRCFVDATVRPEPTLADPFRGTPRRSAW